MNTLLWLVIQLLLFTSRAGSVDMTYSFDVAGTEEIGITSLKDNLLDIFSASGINLDPSMNIDDNKPSMAQGWYG